MPIKLPKGFPRRKSSGNALEELQNPPQPSFRVFERPSSAGKSFDGGNTLKRMSEGRPLSASQYLENYELEDGRPNALLTNRYGVSKSITICQLLTILAVVEEQTTRRPAGVSMIRPRLRHASVPLRLYPLLHRLKLAPTSHLIPNQNHHILFPTLQPCLPHRPRRVSRYELQVGR